MYDAQDEKLTQLFLEKIDGDLSPCNWSWEVLSYLIQGTKKHVTLDLAEGRFNVLNVPSLLTLLDTVCFKRQALYWCSDDYIYSYLHLMVLLALDIL